MSAIEEIALDILGAAIKLAPGIASLFAPDLGSRQDPLAQRVSAMLPERGASAAARDELEGR